MLYYWKRKYFDAGESGLVHRSTKEVRGCNKELETQLRLNKEMLAEKNFQLLGIKSDFDLMSLVFGSYGEMNNAWSGDDMRGFSKIASNQVMIYQKIEELAQKG